MIKSSEFVLSAQFNDADIIYIYIYTYILGVFKIDSFKKYFKVRIQDIDTDDRQFCGEILEVSIKIFVNTRCFTVKKCLNPYRLISPLCTLSHECVTAQKKKKANQTRSI